MIGGAGNDIYIVSATGDRVFETTSPTSTRDAGGVDTVQSAVSLNLNTYAGLRFVENLTLTGKGNLNATGNALGNGLKGNVGDNVLNGGLGRDTLTGGGGHDTFVFDRAITDGNIDRITDFNPVADTIRLSHAIFSGLAIGTLTDSAFAIHKAGEAEGAADRIIYQSDTGKLFFDSTGAGGGAPVQFATLVSGLALTHADFLIF